MNEKGGDGAASTAADSCGYGGQLEEWTRGFFTDPHGVERLGEGQCSMDGH